jgi:hypothetical protein
MRMSKSSFRLKLGISIKFNRNYSSRLEVLEEVKTKIYIFWDIMLYRLVNADVSNEHFVRLSSESTSPTTSGQPDAEDGPIMLPATSANYYHNYNYNDNTA